MNLPSPHCALGAEDEDGALGLGQHPGRPADIAGGGLRDDHGQGRHVPLQPRPREAVPHHGPRGLVGRGLSSGWPQEDVLLGLQRVKILVRGLGAVLHRNHQPSHQLGGQLRPPQARVQPGLRCNDQVRVQDVQGQLHEDGTRHARCRLAERLPQRGDDVADGRDCPASLHDGLQQHALIDVLERAAALHGQRRRAAHEDHRALRHRRILDGRHGVCDARPGRDHGHARDARAAGHGIRGEDGVCLVAHVDDPDARCLRANEERRDVPPCQAEDVGHSVCCQEPCDVAADVVVGLLQGVHQGGAGRLREAAQEPDTICQGATRCCSGR
mmetsp:Transcript_9960/g.31144  ORF Transcript_9960/g.31144 Transcript_9960/m.31144 type:complete len:328 (+) Transcript_9960:1067-2050(+)